MDAVPDDSVQVDTGPVDIGPIMEGAIAENPMENNPLAGAPVELGSDAAIELGALESRAGNASFWTMLSYGSSIPLRLINSLLLTRLLATHLAALGEVTLVTTFIVGVTMLSDIGLVPSVIQSKHGDEPVFLNTAWTLQIIRGAFIALVGLLFAWPLSAFYHDAKLGWLLPGVAICVLATGFNSTSMLSAARHMAVRRLFFLELTTQIVITAVTLTWAKLYPSAWAIIGGTAVGYCYRLYLSHNARAMPGIRNRFHWDKPSVHEIVHFGKWIMIGTAFTFFAGQSDKLMLGKLVPMGVLGVYGIAYQLSDMPRQIIIQLAAKVGYPFVAKIIGLPREEFRANFLRYRSYALMGGALVLSLMVAWGGPLVLKIYPKQINAAGWMVPILAVGLWHTLLYTTTLPVLLSLGKSKYNAYGNAVYCFSIVVGILIGFKLMGLAGAVIAVAAGDLPMYAVTQYGMVKEGVNPLRQDAQMTALFLALLGVFFAMKFFLLGHLFP
jgi:O-antigen/teichoic acid export membrane protein